MLISSNESPGMSLDWRSVLYASGMLLMMTSKRSAWVEVGCEALESLAVDGGALGGGGGWGGVVVVAVVAR